MSTASNIEWTDTTWNPVAGCAKVSAGCKHCYAETMAARHVLMSAAQGRTSPYLPVVDAERRRWRGNFITLPERLADPLSWRKPRRVFVNSMSDLFGEGVPFEFIAAVFGVMAATPRHTYQALTKRPARMVEFFAWCTEVAADEFCGSRVDLVIASAATHVNGDAWDRNLDRAGMAVEGGVWPLPNVWLGVSTEDQATADERIPLLLQVPAVRFISAEPLLGPINLRRLRNGGDALWPRSGGLDWIIVGGESGPGARPCDVSWIRSIVRQCDEAGIPVFVKQLGARARGVPSCMGCEGERFDGDRCERCADVVEIADGQRVLHLRDPKGGDPAEWPEDLRVRQWPREVAHAG